MILVRIKASGHVQEMIPDVARAMIQGGTAELVERRGKDPAAQIPPTTIETAALEHSQQAAIAPAQNPPKRRRGKK